MRPRYLGPLIVISRNRGGAYILAELDGSIFDRPITAFWVIPYFARKSITLPPLDELLDISRQRLAELENTEDIDTDDGPPDDTSLLADDWGQSTAKKGGGLPNKNHNFRLTHTTLRHTRSPTLNRFIAENNNEKSSLCRSYQFISSFQSQPTNTDHKDKFYYLHFSCFQIQF